MRIFIYCQTLCLDKMGWKNWPCWLKWGIYLSLIYIAITIISFALFFIYPFNALILILSSSPGLAIVGWIVRDGIQSAIPKFVNHYETFFSILFSLIFYFIIGAIIGLIVGKFKKK